MNNRFYAVFTEEGLNNQRLFQQAIYQETESLYRMHGYSREIEITNEIMGLSMQLKVFEEAELEDLEHLNKFPNTKYSETFFNNSLFAQRMKDRNEQAGVIIKRIRELQLELSKIDPNKYKAFDSEDSHSYQRILEIARK